MHRTMLDYCDFQVGRHFVMRVTNASTTGRHSKLLNDNKQTTKAANWLLESTRERASAAGRLTAPIAAVNALLAAADAPAPAAQAGRHLPVGPAVPKVVEKGPLPDRHFELGGRCSADRQLLAQAGAPGVRGAGHHHHGGGVRVPLDSYHLVRAGAHTHCIGDIYY
jgi:hypothetical protein